MACTVEGRPLHDHDHDDKLLLLLPLDRIRKLVLPVQATPLVSWLVDGWPDMDELLLIFLLKMEAFHIHRGGILA